MASKKRDLQTSRALNRIASLRDSVNKHDKTDKKITGKVAPKKIVPPLRFFPLMIEARRKK
jgi:hypothetical protein